MVLSNIKSSIEIHESTINQIKANMKDFTFRVDQTEAFYFKPNLNNENIIFGVLNLVF